MEGEKKEAPYPAARIVTPTAATQPEKMELALLEYKAPIATLPTSSTTETIVVVKSSAETGIVVSPCLPVLIESRLPLLPLDNVDAEIIAYGSEELVDVEQTSSLTQSFTIASSSAPQAELQEKQMETSKRMPWSERDDACSPLTSKHEAGAVDAADNGMKWDWSTGGLMHLGTSGIGLAGEMDLRIDFEL